MGSIQRRIAIRKLQKVFWIYLTNNFVITSVNNLGVLTFPDDWKVVSVTQENYFRVQEFREDGLILEYREKLLHGEQGVFAELDGQMVGSIWATTNGGAEPVIVRTYMKLGPREALIHDVFTGEQYRGRGIARFLLQEMVRRLLAKPGAEKIIVDVNFRNSHSLKIMEKCGLRRSEQMLCVSVFGKPMLRSILRRWC